MAYKSRQFSNPFLSNHTARVDPSGDDTTGIIGDLAKPFLTVQAAITAFENDPGIDVSSLYPDGRPPVILLANQSAGGSLTTSLKKLVFQGNGDANTYLFPSLTCSNNITLTFLFVSWDGLTCDGNCIIETSQSVMGQITAGGSVTIVGASGGSSQDSDITAGGNVRIQNVDIADSVISAPGFDIHITNSRPIWLANDGSYEGIPSINSPGSEVWVTDTILGDVTCGTLHLADSRIQGTNSATSTVYADVLLNPNQFNWASVPTSDPHVVGLPWNNGGIFSISAG